jgi:hypothetical protein
MGGMPWKEHRIVDEREAFVRSYLREATPMAELCREHGISRKTGYKWVQRFHDGGMPALMDRSRPKEAATHPIDGSDPNCTGSSIASCTGNPYPESAIVLWHEPTERYETSARADQNWQFVSYTNTGAENEEWFILAGIADWNGIDSWTIALTPSSPWRILHHCCVQESASNNEGPLPVKRYAWLSLVLLGLWGCTDGETSQHLRDGGTDGGDGMDASLGQDAERQEAGQDGTGAVADASGDASEVSAGDGGADALVVVDADMAGDARIDGDTEPCISDPQCDDGNFCTCNPRLPDGGCGTIDMPNCTDPLGLGCCCMAGACVLTPCGCFEECGCFDEECAAFGCL